MKRSRVLLLVGVIALGAAFVGLMTMPSGLLGTSNASGAISNREAVGALVGLLVLGFMVLGLDMRDWF